MLQSGRQWPIKSDMLLQILKGIEAGRPTGQKEKWDKCWAESESLVPPYYNSTVVRENGEYKEVPSGYEYERFKSIRGEVLDKYCPQGFSEFGCGNGHNLVGRSAIGYDWSEAAVQKLNAVGQKAEVFDMFRPRKVQVPNALVTIHSMEQLGKNWQPFLNFILEVKPKIIVHIEPLIELYEDTVFDFLAVMYHRRRAYLEGYLPAVKEVGEIIELRRCYFGNMFHEANSVLVWRPNGCI